eukprot:gene26297-17389_t
MSLDGYARMDDEEVLEDDHYQMSPDWPHFQTLADSATRWFCILRFKSKDEEPFQTNYSPDAFLQLFEQKKLSPGTLICGMTCRYIRKGIVLPGSAFRTYSYLMDQMKAGRNYNPLTDKDLDRGSPKPNWCKLPVFTQVKEDAVQPSNTGSQSHSEMVTRQAVWELLHRAPCYCLSYMYGFNPLSNGIKCAINISSREMHMSGREYLPLSANDMKMVQAQGTQYLSTRRLEQLQVALSSKALPKVPRKLSEKEREREQAERARKAKADAEAAATAAAIEAVAGLQASETVHSNFSSPGNFPSLSNSNSNPPPQTLSPQPTPSHGYQAPHPAAPANFALPMPRPVLNATASAAPSWNEPTRQAAPSTTTSTIPTPHAPPAHPFPTPVPLPLPVPAPTRSLHPSADYSKPQIVSPKPAAPMSVAPHQRNAGRMHQLSLGEGASSSYPNQLPDFSKVLSTTLSPGSSDSFQTSLFRLFMGTHAQHALSSVWWHVATKQRSIPQGPFSAEQMLLAVLSGLIDQAALVCGTEGDAPVEQMLLAVLSGLIDQAV